QVEVAAKPGRDEQLAGAAGARADRQPDRDARSCLGRRPDLAERDHLVAEQAELDTQLGRVLAVPLEAGLLEVLDGEAVLDQLVADRQAEDGRAAAPLPEVAEAAADRVLGLLEPAAVGVG